MKRIALPLLVLSSLLTVSGAWAETRPQYGGTLRVSTHIPLASLDPADDSQPDSIARRTLVSLVFDRLVTVDARGQLHPALASSWQADNGNQRWTFVLRPDVRFHDGSPLTASAVAASLRTSNPTWKILDGPGSIVIERDSPAPALAADLARSRNSIVKRDGGTITGTGAFRVKSFLPGKHVTLIANEDAWAGRPYVDTIEIDLGRSGRDQLISVESGHVDIADITPDQGARATATGHRVLSSSPVELVALAYLRGPQSADDRSLRSALALSIDRSSIRHVILQSVGESTAALLPNWISGYAFLFSGTQNLALARQKRAELRQPAALTLAYDPSDSLVQLVAERIILNAKDAGITLQITSSATPDVRLIRAPLDSSDPRLALQSMCSRFDLPIPALPDSSSDTLYRAENAALQTQHVLPLFYLPVSYALSPELRDLTLTIDGNPQLADVWLGAPAP